MSQTPVEFLKLASSLIPEFDGKAADLQGFIDALNLVDSLKGSHEEIAVSLIKTKLKGYARSLISNERSVPAIINTLYKIQIQYTREVHKLTKSLERAYINDGLTPELARKYSETLAKHT